MLKIHFQLQLNQIYVFVIEKILQYFAYVFMHNIKIYL